MKYLWLMRNKIYSTIYNETIRNNTSHRISSCIGTY